MSELQPLLLSIDELADALRLSRRCIEYWQAQGRLPGFVRVYGHRRWRRDVIQAWIAAGCPELSGEGMQINAIQNSDL